MVRGGVGVWGDACWVKGVGVSYGIGLFFSFGWGDGWKG